MRSFDVLWQWCDTDLLIREKMSSEKEGNLELHHLSWQNGHTAIISSPGGDDTNTNKTSPIFFLN